MTIAQRFYHHLGRVKNTPAVWGMFAPLLLAGAVWMQPHMALVPVVFFVLASLIPEKEGKNAQRIHFLLAYCAVKFSAAHPVPVLHGWWAFLIVVPVAFFLEYYWDPKYEPDPWKWGGVWDFADYLAGGLLAVPGALLWL